MPSRAPLATAHIALNKQTNLVIRLYMRRQPGALSILKEGIKTSKSASSIGRAGRESASRRRGLNRLATNLPSS
jgi:hypothetical protein